MTNGTSTANGSSADSPGCVAQIDIDPGGLFFGDTMASYDGFSGILAPYQLRDGTIHALLRTNRIEYGILEDRGRIDSTVKAVDYLRTVNGDHLYDLELLFASKCPFNGLNPDEFQVYSAEGVADKWRVVIRFSSPELLESCRRAAEKEGIDWVVRHVYQDGGYNPLDELTPIQRETVEKALELGYFEIPRGISMEELAAELDITPNAVSERLRRAERKLLSSLSSP